MLSVEKLDVWYARDRRWRQAVRDVSFRIGRGEAYGLVGESGSGKSSVALAVLRYLPPRARMSAAALTFEGRDLGGLSDRALRAVRGSRLSAVYQHPGAALNPSLTIGRQIGETLRAHRGLDAGAARARSLDLLRRVHVRDPGAVLGLYPHELSGGMQQRATIAMAIALEPALLVLDEPTTALDASVRGEIVAILDDLRRHHGTSLLLISHDIGLVHRVADRVGVMQGGMVVEQGAAEAVFTRPAHPYTRGLIDSLPRPGLTRKHGRLTSPGRTPPRAPGSAEDADPGRGVPALRCSGVVQRFGSTTILHGVDLTIAPGETYGLIGESGSGKSTLARIVTGLQRPAAGAVELFGAPAAPTVERRSRAERRAVQMVFQSPDATLNPRHRLRRILAQPLRRLAGLRGTALARRAAALIEAVRLLPEHASSRPKTLSGGQKQRAAIARAFAGSPRLVVLDEPTSALDVSVQAAILDLLNDLQRDNGAAYLFISHDLAVVRYMADHVGVLYRGHLVEAGPAARVFAGPNHPYTAMLLAAAFEGGPAEGARPAGSHAADAAGAPAGCAFAPRCPIVEPRCRREAPPAQRRDGHRILCWRIPADDGPERRSTAA